jgi:hypothetical protein
VRRLPAVSSGVGEFTLSWDGRTESGEPAASGVYFLEVSARGERAVRKLLLLRPAG